MSKMNLPSVPRSADRDTTVFLQSLKKAIEMLHVGGKTELSEGAKSYVLRIDKKTREDLVGVIGDEAGVGAILDKIKGQITESELSIHLGERIAKITSNENAISEERLQRVADVLAANEAIIDEARARVQAITDSSNLLQSNIENEALERFNVDEGLRQDLVNEIITRSDETGELISQFNGLYAQANPKMAGDTEGWAGDDSYFAGVWSERSAIIEQGLATAKVTDGLLSNINDNKAAITQVNQTLVTKTEVTASQLNRLSAQMVGGYDGNDLQEVTSGLIHQERQARATETEGLAQQISLLSAGVGEQFDSFEIWHFNNSNDGWAGGVYQDGWLNVKNETLVSPTITLDGSMYKHVKIRIQKFGTPTWQGLLSYAGGSITALEPSYTEDGIALVNFYAQWSGAITSFSLKLASTASASNYFLVDWIAVGRPSPGASNAALLREEKARADKDRAIAQDVTALNTQINGDGTSSSSSIVQQLTTVSSKTDTNARDISGLASKFDTEMYSAEGIITRNAETAASASAANASDISGVFAQVNPKMAGDTDGWAGDDSPANLVGVWSERSARIEDGIHTAERFDAMTARVDGNAAAISTESKIRADAISSLAQRTDTIRADFDANAGTVQGQISEAQSRLNTVEQESASALSSLVDISADNKLTPIEKKQITVIWNEIKKSDAGIRERATKYGLSVAVYNTAYVALNSYLEPIMASLSQTSVIARTTFDTNFSNLYVKRTELETAIVSAIKSEATSLSGNAAVIQTQIKAVADNYTALSQRTDTVQSTVDGHTSSIEIQQRAINGINASWSIKADVNGVVGGLGVVNDGRTVDFIMRASSFAIQGPSGSKSVPFVSYPDGTVIDGIPIPAGNYLEDTFIRRASIDTLDIKGNAVTVPVSAFTEAAIAVGDIYTTIQSLPVPADMGHTMLNFNAIFNFPGYARVQSILCRIVKGGAIIADNIEVFFSEARSASRATSTHDATGHTHGGSFQGSTFVSGVGNITISGPINVMSTNTGSHGHNIDVANDNRNAGSFALSRHDSTGAAGIYELQMRVSNGGTANISQRYIHAITMRR